VNAAGRLGAYAAGVVVVFAGAFAAAGAVVPAETVEAWTQQTEGSAVEQHGTDEHSQDQAPVGTTSTGYADHPPQGVTVEQSGYLLREVSAPRTTEEAGELAFTITGPDGAPVTDYDTEHEKDLHLIVVRSDGAHYRHVHPVMDEDGRWSMPWRWEAAGTYRIYADFSPAGDGESLTLTRTAHVAGAFDPATPEVTVTDQVDGYQVSLEGGLSAGSDSDLAISVTRDGAPITTLQPYLGAYGHLVALRAGDLAYLHVHPEGVEPIPGQTSGPEVEFATTAPSPGRYYLYFDFQVDGTVHTAQFALDTTDTTGGTATASSTTTAEHGGH